MKFGCVNRTDEYSLKIEEEIIKKLTDKGHILDNSDPQYVFSIGGDGTFIKAVNKYLKNGIIFININTGSFGYLCEFEVDQIDELINNIEKYEYKEFSLLELNLNNEEKLYAVNEFRIHSRHGRTISLDLFINDNFLESLRGDGVIVSSSIGSSGVSRSLGGALIDNEIEMLQIVEEAPILNFKYGSLHSSFVLNKDKHITLKNFTYPFHIFYDSSDRMCNDTNVFLDIKLSSKKIRILKNPLTNYIEKTSKLFTR